MSHKSRFNVDHKLYIKVIIIIPTVGEDRRKALKISDVLLFQSHAETDIGGYDWNRTGSFLSLNTSSIASKLIGKGRLKISL